MTAQIRLDEARAKGAAMRRVRVIPWNGAVDAFEGNFHAWAGLSERPFAIVELFSGKIHLCETRDIVEFLEPPDAPVVDASRVPTPHRWTAADVRTQALFHAKNAAPVDTVAMLRAYAKLLDATPEAGSPAEDDAKLIEFCEALEIDIDLVNLTLAHVIDKLGGDSEFVPLLRGAFKRLSDQQDAAASLRARPQQEGNR